METQILKGLAPYTKIQIIKGRLRSMDAIKVKDGRDYMIVSLIGNLPKGLPNSWYKAKRFKVPYKYMTCPEIKLIKAL